MKKSLCSLLLLCITLTAVAQKNSQKEDFPNEDVSLITFNLLTPFAFDTPRYRLGYTHGITKHIRAGVEVGYGSEGTTVTITNTSNSDSYSLFEILPQVSYIFNPTYPVNHYIALQGFYLNHNERFYNDYYNDTDVNVGIYYDVADYNRKKIGANLLYGVYIPFGDAPVGIDISGGLGIRSRKNTYSNLRNINQNNGFNDDDDGFIYNIDYYREDSGTRVGINFSLGFKLTYNLNN